MYVRVLPSIIVIECNLVSIVDMMVFRAKWMKQGRAPIEVQRN